MRIRAIGIDGQRRGIRTQKARDFWRAGCGIFFWLSGPARWRQHVSRGWLFVFVVPRVRIAAAAAAAVFGRLYDA